MNSSLQYDATDTVLDCNYLLLLLLHRYRLQRCLLRICRIDTEARSQLMPLICVLMTYVSEREHACLCLNALSIDAADMRFDDY